MPNIIQFEIITLKSIRAIILTPTLLLAAATSMATAKPNDPFTYLENGITRIGVDKSRGSPIGYFSLSKAPRNLLNHHDDGRFIQQSYCGDPDGSMWGKTPWRYNPVQGGSYKGEDAKTLEFRQSNNELFAKVEPLRWASAKPCPEAIMQEWITLDGPVARIRMQMTCTGPTNKAAAHQEMPAMFVDYALPHLMFERDGKPVKHAPIDLGTNPQAGGHPLHRWLARFRG